MQTNSCLRNTLADGVGHTFLRVIPCPAKKRHGVAMLVFTPRSDTISRNSARVGLDHLKNEGRVVLDLCRSTIAAPDLARWPAMSEHQLRQRTRPPR